MAVLAYLVAALAAFAAAETLKDCAGSCVSKGIEQTGCASANSQCICAAPAFMETIQECVTSCAEADQTSALAVASGLCEAVSSTKDLKRDLHSIRKRQFGNWGGFGAGERGGFGAGERGGFGSSGERAGFGGWGQPSQNQGQPGHGNSGQGWSNPFGNSGHNQNPPTPTHNNPWPVWPTHPSQTVW